MSKRIKGSEQSATSKGQKLLFSGVFKRDSDIPDEDNVHSLICDYLNEKHPDVLFLSDPSGIRVSIGLAKKISKRSSKHKIPDIIILEPRHGYCGMVLEVKRDRDTLVKKNGDIRKSEHYQEQYNTLHHLHKKGYMALFGLGYEDSIRKIEIYLGPRKPIVKN